LNSIIVPTCMSGTPDFTIKNLYPTHFWSTVLGPNFRFLVIGTLIFAKQPHVRKYESVGLFFSHSSNSVISLFFVGIQFRTWHAVNIASPHHSLESPVVSNMALTKSVRVWFFL